jgi:hypothetical protein
MGKLHETLTLYFPFYIALEIYNLGLLACALAFLSQTRQTSVSEGNLMEVRSTPHQSLPII